MPRRTGLVLFALFVFSCGDSTVEDAATLDSRIGDAALDGTPDAAPSVSTPAPPLAPVFTPCPTGWREVREAGPVGPVTCDPWPAGGRVRDCARGMAHFPGEPGCASVGDPCPVGDFPEGLPSGREIHHVRAGAVAGGDGSATAPHGSIAAAFGAASDGAIVAVAAGVYEERVVIDRDLTLWGACTDVVIQNDGPVGAIRVDGGHAVVRNVRIASSREGIWFTGGEADVTGVIVDGVTGTPVVVLMPERVSIESFAVRDTETTAVLISGANASVTLDRAVIARGGSFAITSLSENLVVSDALIEGVGSPVSLLSPAVFIWQDAVATLTRVSIENIASDPLVVTMGATVRATDLRVVGPPSSTSLPSTTVTVTERSSLSLDRAVFLRSREIGLAASTSGASIDARDVLIADTEPSPELEYGFGFAAGFGASVELERLHVSNARSIGVVIDGFGTEATISDLVVRSTRAGVRGFFGRAIQVQNAATLTLARALLTDNHEASLVAAGGGASGVVTDVEVVSTLSRACAPATCPSAGMGVGAYDRASLRLERFRVADSHLAGVQVAVAGELDLHDGLIEGNPVGANVQVSDYDIGRLSDRVVYRDNGVNLGSDDLPVPQPADPVGP